jgi:Zn-dependent M28 family amino/carboxypeptidase
MRRIFAGFAIAAAFLLAVLSATGADRAATQAKAKAAASPSYGNADAITQEELKVYEYFLASDQLEGRNIPSRGYDTAALYIASHLAEWGLRPGGSATGANGPLQPYFMPMEMVARQIVPAESKASLTAPPPAGRGGRGGAAAGAQAGAARGGAGDSAEPRTTNFEYGKDWSVGGALAGGGRGAAAVAAVDVSGNLVFAGNGYVIEKTKTNPYSGLDVRGKIVVVAGLPPELAALPPAGGRGRGGANAPNPLGEACTDYWSPEQYAAKNGALGVVTIANFQQLAAVANPAAAGRGVSLNGPSFQVAKFQTPPACPSAPSITAGIDLTNAVFQGEKLTGAQVFYAAGANARQDSFELDARKKLSLHVEVHSERGHAENVVGIVEGGDPVLKDEYVVMSAHLDHLGLSAPLPDGHSVFNGADDDASGCAGLMAAARAYAEGAAKGVRPKRSMVFLWMGGEEKGLWGSQYFVQFPSIDVGKIVANLNLDMIGRTKNAASVDTDATHVLVNPGEVLVVGPNISSDDMEQAIEAVNGAYQKLKLNHFYDVTAPDATHDNLGPQPNGQRIFYRSDHYNFAKMGIPIAFFTTGLHVDYHRATDTPEKIDYQEMQQIAKTVAAIGWEIGNRPVRLKLKATLPDQLVKDMKAAQTQGWGKLTPVLPPLPGEPY